MDGRPPVRPLEGEREIGKEKFQLILDDSETRLSKQHAADGYWIRSGTPRVQSHAGKSDSDDSSF